MEITGVLRGIRFEGNNGWLAIFKGGSTIYWPSSLDGLPWDRFDPSISLSHCASKGIPIHCWHDDNGFHVEAA